MERLIACEPDILQGQSCWLAVTPRDHPYRIGVMGASEEEARRRFGAALAAWSELHERALVSDTQCDETA